MERAHPKKLDLVDMYGPEFPSVEVRLYQAYQDPVVHERFIAIMRAPQEERAGLRTQMDTYLAAAHVLFPEESQIIHDSLRQFDAR